MIGNIPPHLRSRISTIQLVALCIEKYFNHTEFYGPVVSDLRDLETGGVLIPSVGIVKGSLVCIVRDNLGSHGLGGFVEQFSSSLYFCRFCLVNRSDFHKEGGELVSFQRRTIDSYNAALDYLKATKKKVYHGVKFNSIFNELNYYHVCNGLPPCLAHDLNEGVIAYDMKIFIDYFVEKEWKSLFPSVPLRPKAYYLTHYCELIEAFGPLIGVFTLRFESKHTFFKRCIRGSRNFKTPTLSLSVTHELFQAYRRSGVDKHFKLNVKGDSEFFMHSYFVEIQNGISAMKLPSAVSECVSVELLGTLYQKGDVVVIRQATYQCAVEMGRIIVVLFDNKDCVYLLLEKLPTEFVPHLRVYEIGCRISYKYIPVADLLSEQSLHVYPSGPHLYVKLHYGLVCDTLD
ncbi:6,7-dimethyl-8-ribityllumazine synthase [Frankliniella fusca]|uniref:6,7-dimethyl-8-ribityllumazine synthase n=1 Tax=Frankliniella fusca TaxID=407009 RepID=A0AAE1H6V4_9NEOP|nr:6,7-dimethyl-8-ribityllumazine synthase [Frankliniella fusca]